MNAQSLKSLQQLIQQQITIQKISDSSMLQSDLKKSSHERLELYANAYLSRLTNSLTEDFFNTKNQIEQNNIGNWEETLFNFVTTHPSQYYDISQYSEIFPEYLLTINSQVAETAFLEWLEILSARNPLPTTTIEVSENTILHSQKKIFEFNHKFYSYNNNNEPIELTKNELWLLQFLSSPKTIEEVADFSALNKMAPSDVQKFFSTLY